MAQGEPQSALPILRRAWGLWQRVDVPYEAAKTRLEVGAACRALGDDDAGRMEIDAARTAFQQLGAWLTSPPSTTTSAAPRKAR